VNVWLALAHEIHPHHPSVVAWEQSLPANTILGFCRFTQLGLLRLLTNSAAMQADVLTRAQAWRAFDAWSHLPTVKMLEEPRGLEAIFRRRTEREEVSTKQWADAYLAAFAEAASLTLVTFDRALAAQGIGAILLR
jgi:toxin-antitoxin system PIN domain toxin